MSPPTPATVQPPSPPARSPPRSIPLLALPGQLSDQLRGSLKTLQTNIGDTIEKAKLPSGIEIKFAPLKVPRHRRLQTAAVALWSTLLPICLAFFCFCCSMPFLWPILIPYVLWIVYVDRAPREGGRPKKWFKRLVIWKHFANYYPVSLVREAKLPTSKKYIFGYHPHGVIGMGALANFGTEGTNFSKIFPGITPHLLTLAPNFLIPFYRDILLHLGLCSVSKRACSTILRRGSLGTAIVIVIGGATESLRAHPGTNDLTLKRRMGFIKIAIREGADLVPVFSFGENDIYDQLANERGTTIYKIQKGFQAMFGFTLPMFHGRGVFNYNLGLMPYRHPIVTVVGRPVHVVQHDNPTNEQLYETQQRYIDELLRIWETYKDVYARNRTRELTLVD